MDAGIYTLPLVIPFFIQPVQFLPERTPGTRDHDGRFHAICQFDRLYYIYFPVILVVSLVIWSYHEKNEKLTSRTVSAQLPTDQAWSLVRLRVSISLFFPQCQVLSKWGEGAIERAYGYCQIWCTSCNWPAWEKNAPTGCYNGGDCVKSGDTSRCRGKKENSRQTSFSPLALSAKRTPTPTTCLAVTNNSSIQKCLHQDTQNHGAGKTAKRRIRKGVDADARPGVGAGRTGGLTCPCLRR